MKSLLIIFLVIILLMPVFPAERDIDLNDNKEGISATTLSVNEVKTTEVIVQSSGGGGGDIIKYYPAPTPKEEEESKEVGEKKKPQEDKNLKIQEDKTSTEEKREGEAGTETNIITGSVAKVPMKASPLIGGIITVLIVSGGLSSYILFVTRRNNRIKKKRKK